MSIPLPCIVCKRTLGHATPFEESNQPLDGLAFHSRGAYGSTVFDPMDGSAIEVNICDRCLADAASVGAVLEYPARRETKRYWSASADTHPKGGDVKQAPLVSGAVPDRADAQETPSPAAEEPSRGNNRDGQIR